MAKIRYVVAGCEVNPRHAFSQHWILSLLCWGRVPEPRVTEYSEGHWTCSKQSKGDHACGSLRMGWMADPGMEVAGRGQRVTLSSEMRRGSDIRLAFVPELACWCPPLLGGILRPGVHCHGDRGGSR